MIDEYPILFVAAALAGGTTVARGLEELRVKESDRIAVMAEGLRACGVRVEELEDGLVVHGTGGERLAGGETVASHMDHRIALSFTVIGLAAHRPVIVEHDRARATSSPSFVPLLDAYVAE